MLKQMGMDPWEKKSRTLTKALIISGALNIAFAGSLIALSLKRPSLAIEEGRRETVRHLSSAEVVSAYFPLTFAELIERLAAKEAVEDGFFQRDIALAVLVDYHHFNVERALSGLRVQKRSMLFTNPEGGEEIRLTFFPGLKEGDYEALMHFAEKETWPLTARGLFYELKRGNMEPSLIQAFKMTSAYDALAASFGEGALELCLEGDFEALLACSLERYLELGSKKAAEIFFEIHPVKHLENQALMRPLSLIEKETEAVHAALEELVDSPRPDEIRALAASHLYRWRGLSLGASYDHPQVLHTLFPDKYPEVMRSHLVRMGDTLWDLSRRYKVSMEKICEANGLEKDRALKVGLELKIPL